MPADVSVVIDDPWEKTVLRDVAVGRTVGEYVIRRRVGEGGMGIVYEAEHPQIGRRVAIKIIRPDGMSRDLLGEARAASAIRHRHIIDVFGFGELEGLGQYLIMDFLDGVPLDQEILTKAPMTADQVIPILDDTLAALSAAHAKGIVHRDLKPGNLFLVQESSGTRYVKVLDFGLAKATAGSPVGTKRETREGVAVGTPEYMAPEQAQAKPVDARTDLYALGVIAYEMLTGRVPFTAATPLAVAMLQVTDAPAPPRSIEQSIPTPLEALVLELMSKNPADRPPTAEAVRAELKKIRRMLMQDQTVAVPAPVAEPPRPLVTPIDNAKARPPRDTERTPIEPPKRRPPAIAFALGAVLLLIGAGVAYVVTRPPAEPVQAQPKPEPKPVVPPPLPAKVADPAPPAPTPPVAKPAPPPSTVPDAVPIVVPPPKPKPKKGSGTLRVVARGCSMEIAVDGKSLGHTPHEPFTLPAGEHAVRLTNALCAPDKFERRVTVKPGEEVLVEESAKPR